MSIITIDDRILAFNAQQQAQAEVVMRMLALCFSKPLETLSGIPEDWGQCVHCDYQTEATWLDVERELLPMLNNLAGVLVTGHSDCVPVDICMIRRPGGREFGIAVRYRRKA